ncbi:hypothetical protein F5148DRAFT_10741 [Russula earlei]|uniref:Uncharacterized protein n=1 Tax=Russula earlei TaxID=71964 RepID=A0ACC0UR11_9AGAM|nr:hypothetical protein F5148DRAFT_10741 [Russula earlei]
MRAFLGLLAGLVSVVSASYALLPRQVPGYPACSQPCLLNATSTKCSAGEVACECQDQQFVASVTACFVSSCNGTDLQTAEQAARANCAAAGVTLTATSATSTPATGSTPTSSQSSPSGSSTSKSSGADSTMVNMIGAAAALGVAVLAL